MQQLWNRAIVVGASSGTGEQIARQLAGSGARVALVARRAERLEAICADINAQAGDERVFACAHDVRDTASAPRLFQELTARLGGLDLIVYAAGIMPLVGPLEFPTETDMDIIDTNLKGAVAWLNEAATRFSRAGEGTIAGISSVAGDRGRRPNPVYSATKAALQSYLSSLRNRLAVQGVTVVTVKGGYVRTPMVEGVPLPPLLPVITPEEAATAILEAVRRGKRVVYVPGWWRYLMLVIRALPAPVMERLKF
jgi:short-subunit dehydrogenase